MAPTPYQYRFRPGDDPLTVAEQFGITPEQLLNANPGGAPFSTGQTLKIPHPPRTTTGTGYRYQPPAPPSWMPALSVNYNWKGPQYQQQLQQGYSQAGWYGVTNTLPGIATDIGMEAANTVNQAVNSGIGIVNAVGGEAWRRYKDAYGGLSDEQIQAIALVNPGLAASFLNSRPVGTTEGRNPTTGEPLPFSSSAPTWQDRAALGVENGYVPQSYLNIIKRLSRGEDVNLSTEQRKFLEGFFNTPAARAAQAAQTPGGGGNTDYANTAAAQAYAEAGTPFLQQKRWDPQRKKYVSLGRLLRQGKIDLQGNWHRRGRGGGGRQQQQAQAAQDYTLANSLINFSASSG